MVPKLDTALVVQLPNKCNLMCQGSNPHARPSDGSHPKLSQNEHFKGKG